MPLLRNPAQISNAQKHLSEHYSRTKILYTDLFKRKGLIPKFKTPEHSEAQGVCTQDPAMSLVKWKRIPSEKGRKKNM